MPGVEEMEIGRLRAAEIPELAGLLGEMKVSFAAVSYTHLTLPTNREV